MTTKNDFECKHKVLTIAQFSDSHLFADLDGLHHKVNVYENLKQTLVSIAENPSIDYAIFTGDLTQDHTEQSYKNFADAVQLANINIPILYLAGNHDEPSLLKKYLTAAPFISDNKIDSEHWQIQLINSKSDTPAGLVSDKTLMALPQRLDCNKYQLLLMHHHPIDVGYFIDKHGLQNKAHFWQAITTYNDNNKGIIKALACGHVHRASVLTTQSNTPAVVQAKASIDLYTCPATSIQFDPNAETVCALAQGPAYRLFYLYQDGTLNSDIVHV